MSLRMTAGLGPTVLCALLAVGCTAEAKHTGRRPEGDRRPLPTVLDGADGKAPPRAPTPTRTVESERPAGGAIRPPKSSFDDARRR